MDSVTRPDDSLTSPYRAVRPVTAPGDGPWPGMLTSLPSGECGVFVEAQLLGPEWGGWDAASDGHVLAALDVVRVQGGHEVVLPVCPESVDAFVRRRQGSGAHLTRGEAVTIGVSLIRGCAEALAHDHRVGAWWLTEAGRPVFATDASPLPLLEGTLGLLDALSRAVPHPTAWADAASALSMPRVSAAELDRAEVGLFSLADPVMLDLRPSPAFGVEPTGRADAPEIAEREQPRRLWESLARHVDADLADLVSRSTTAVWRRARRREGTPRRAPLIVGATVAAAVVGVGLMWPGDEGSVAAPEASPTRAAASATPAAGAPSERASSEPAAPSTETPDAAPATAEDLERVAARLSERLDDCGDDEDCRGRIARDGATSRLQTLEIAADRRSFALLDDFGDIAVLRVDDKTKQSPSQLVVIARRDGEWLLRDVHDATQQP